MKVARELEVELHSATGLKSASTLAVYCVAWVEPSVRVPSPSTKAHGAHPEFHTSIVLTLDERTLGRGQHLNIEILGQGLVSTRRVGYVRVSLSELLQQESRDGGEVHTQFNAHPVTRRSGRQQGFLSFDLHIRPADPASKAPEPAVMSRRLTMEPTPSQPKIITTLRERFEAETGDQSDDVVSPTSSSSEAGHSSKVGSRKRLFALRPRSFSFNGCASQPPQKAH